jgi:hypothetical protein
VTSRATTRVALAQVRAVQDRDTEAEELFREAVEIVSGAEHCRVGFDVLPPYADFLRARGRVDREDDARVARERAEALGPRVVHPELPLEVDLAGRVAPFLQECDGLLRAFPRRHAGRAVVELGHVPRVLHRCQGSGVRLFRAGGTPRFSQTPSTGPLRGQAAHAAAVRPGFYPHSMATKPTRIDLLELDIDLRLTDLWREAGEITEWNLDVVAAFMRAAYGKGYCDALTEDAPGSLCHDHGYRIPGRRPAPAHD